MRLLRISPVDTAPKFRALHNLLVSQVEINRFLTVRNNFYSSTSLFFSIGERNNIILCTIVNLSLYVCQGAALTNITEIVSFQSIFHSSLSLLKQVEDQLRPTLTCQTSTQGLPSIQHVCNILQITFTLVLPTFNSCPSSNLMVHCMIQLTIGEIVKYIDKKVVLYGRSGT